MVDIAAKDVTAREAVASAKVHMRRETLEQLRSGNTKKGDVLAAARIAGIGAAKRTPELIPLCHHVALSSVEVRFEMEEHDDDIAASVASVVDVPFDSGTISLNSKGQGPLDDEQRARLLERGGVEISEDDDAEPMDLQEKAAGEVARRDRLALTDIDRQRLAIHGALY